jgi:hypothetical protein
MERTKGITIWLSQESMDVSNIVTTKCADIDVSVPTGRLDGEYERKQLSLPEKYVHQFAGGHVKSRVSSAC